VKRSAIHIFSINSFRPVVWSPVSPVSSNCFVSLRSSFHIFRTNFLRVTIWVEFYSWINVVNEGDTECTPVSFEVQTFGKKKKLTLTQFVQDIMSFSTRYDFSCHKPKASKYFPSLLWTLGAKTVIRFFHNEFWWDHVILKLGVILEKREVV
jgi:hypothetical protein